ncbi:MAG TPA: acetyl/propionyl/methylcrotonyl-CoA carboxylase subunit alpha [Candidatus Sulfotelmatobacter sp.]|nr:acetyl/propionyl/methylcrotonyl-CoA carboxylase subunit alpha [Candidatus Sulfotelmatobacter sp.]
MFRKLLIANRGEIACQIIATARRLGLRTVAVYSDADAGARHVSMADEAYRIGPAAAAESYLNAGAIIQAAKQSGAAAIHPGYGFLSENAEFAEACAAAGVVFVGPPPAAIRAMGLKGAAKALMEAAGVPVVPGYHGDDQSPAKLRAEAMRIGYPVLIKAVAGGGGKGMRRVDAAIEFDAALAGAQREARGAFGNDKVLIEKYLVKPRHIEMQVFADRQGNAVHLFERDCSLQRRHQKVLEEAPAPGMPKAMRQAMGQAAVAAVKAIGYVGAGTVEFIADVAKGLRADAFYFMEMNTRLQVEHPVTEMITGLDLVEWQLRVAAGEPLPLAQAEVPLQGHALEVRLYAEDPARGFLPATGTLHRLRLPAGSRHVRVDTGVREGDAVTPFYDPMIAKLVVWDRDRPSALSRLAGALAECQVAGCVTNLGFLARVAVHPAFAAAELDTGFIERHRAALVPAAEPLADRALALAATAVLLQRQAGAAAAAAASADPHSPWHAVDGWRMNGSAHGELGFRRPGEDEPVTVRVDYRRQGWSLALPGGTLAVEAASDGDGGIVASLGGVRLAAAAVLRGHEVTVMAEGISERLLLDDPLDVGNVEEGAAGAVTAPMPGKIVQVLVEAGAEVAKGKGLMILEAMKMEHTIAAPRDGTIAKINVSVGEQVQEGTVLVAFTEEKQA